VQLSHGDVSDSPAIKIGGQANCRTAGREEKRAGVKEGAKPISSFLLAEVQKAQGVIIRYSVFTELQRDRGVSTKMGEDAERICSREY